MKRAPFLTPLYRFTTKTLEKGFTPERFRVFARNTRNATTDSARLPDQLRTAPLRKPV